MRFGLDLFPEDSLRYAGIGSRKAPRVIQGIMTEVALDLQDEGFILSSGAARGSDKAFERGAGDRKEIWLPELGFEGSTSQMLASPEAYEMAKSIHPNWGACDRFARAAHARNCHQILWETLDRPVKFVLCWTEGGLAIGGTATALEIARLNNVPIYNMGKPGNEQSSKIVAFIEKFL